MAFIPTTFNYIDYDFLKNSIHISSDTVTEWDSYDSTSPPVLQLIQIASRRINSLVSKDNENNVIETAIINGEWDTFFTDLEKNAIQYATGWLCDFYLKNGYDFNRGAGGFSEGAISASITNPENPDYVPPIVLEFLVDVNLYVYRQSVTSSSEYSDNIYCESSTSYNSCSQYLLSADAFKNFVRVTSAAGTPPTLLNRFTTNTPNFLNIEASFTSTNEPQINLDIQNVPSQSEIDKKAQVYIDDNLFENANIKGSSSVSITQDGQDAVFKANLGVIENLPYNFVYPDPTNSNTFNFTYAKGIKQTQHSTLINGINKIYDTTQDLVYIIHNNSTQLEWTADHLTYTSVILPVGVNVINNILTATVNNISTTYFGTNIGLFYALVSDPDNLQLVGASTVGVVAKNINNAETRQITSNKEKRADNALVLFTTVSTNSGEGLYQIDPADNTVLYWLNVSNLGINKDQYIKFKAGYFWNSFQYGALWYLKVVSENYLTTYNNLWGNGIDGNNANLQSNLAGNIGYQLEDIVYIQGEKNYYYYLGKDKGISYFYQNAGTLGTQALVAPASTFVNNPNIQAVVKDQNKNVYYWIDDIAIAGIYTFYGSVSTTPPLPAGYIPGLPFTDVIIGLKSDDLVYVLTDTNLYTVIPTAISLVNSEIPIAETHASLDFGHTIIYVGTTDNGYYILAEGEDGIMTKSLHTSLGGGGSSGGSSGVGTVNKSFIDPPSGDWNWVGSDYFKLIGQITPQDTIGILSVTYRDINPEKSQTYAEGFITNNYNWLHNIGGNFPNTGTQGGIPYKITRKSTTFVMSDLTFEDEFTCSLPDLKDFLFTNNDFKTSIEWMVANEAQTGGFSNPFWRTYLISFDINWSNLRIGVFSVSSPTAPKLYDVEGTNKVFRLWPGFEYQALLNNNPDQATKFNDLVYTNGGYIANNIFEMIELLNTTATAPNGLLSQDVDDRPNIGARLAINVNPITSEVKLMMPDDSVGNNILKFESSSIVNSSVKIRINLYEVIKFT